MLNDMGADTALANQLLEMLLVTQKLGEEHRDRLLKSSF